MKESSKSATAKLFKWIFSKDIMGKTKSKVLRKAGKVLDNEGVQFSRDFEKNKKIATQLSLSKKQRNQMAGFMSRTKKLEARKAKL